MKNLKKFIVDAGRIAAGAAILYTLNQTEIVQNYDAAVKAAKDRAENIGGMATMAGPF